MQITEADIRRMLVEFIGVQKPTMLAKVVSVDMNLNTCTVDDDGTEVFEVRLLPIVSSNNSILKVPSVGAFVLCVKIEDTDEWKVESSSKYDKAIILIGNQKIEISENIIINDGKNGGVVVSQKVIDTMEIQIKRINNIVKALQNLSKALSLTPPTTPLTTGALSSAINTAIASIVAPLQVPQATSIENEKFKH